MANPPEQLSLFRTSLISEKTAIEQKLYLLNQCIIELSAELVTPRGLLRQRISMTQNATVHTANTVKKMLEELNRLDSYILPNNLLLQQRPVQRRLIGQFNEDKEESVVPNYEPNACHPLFPTY